MKDTSLSARRALRESASGYAFILPQMIGFFLFVLIPLVNVFIYSFQNRNMLFGTSNPIGFQNYATLFQDSLFYLTLKNTLIFSVFLVPLNLALALGLALYLGDGNFGTRYIRAIIFLPVVTSGVAWSIVWKYLLQGGHGGSHQLGAGSAGHSGAQLASGKGLGHGRGGRHPRAEKPGHQRPGILRRSHEPAGRNRGGGAH